ncbi:MAG TPA: GspMb/PilO family protein [Methylibium sp.]|uniref:GspMb/PilO family protein n=1 Tax=Methylibium sp. TaxID=2067992 RepID=UPI002DBFBF4E|nr:GspMb/PilO family protein [Methylibium sp.]HEU4460137.1 GspMb/PilO family protein [Methylibium sp.]
MSFGIDRLALERLWQRHGAAPWIAGGCFALGVGAWLLWLPARIDAARQRAEAAVAVPLATALPRRADTQPRLAAVPAGAWIAALPALAATHGVQLGRVAVQWIDATPARVEIEAPLRAPYPGLRAFLQALPADAPGLRVQRLSVRREGDSATRLLDVRVALVLPLDARASDAEP